MAGSAVVAEVPGEADAMEQTSAEAVAAAEEPMQTECQGELGEEGAVRVIAIDESAAGEEGTILQVHVAMEAQPGQGDQAEVKSPFIYLVRYTVQIVSKLLTTIRKITESKIHSLKKIDICCKAVL